MNIHLNKNNPIPVGVQVKEQIKILIHSGYYKNGDKLPAINQLAGNLGVNKNTIVAALKELQKEGYLDSQRGKGIYIKVKKANNKTFDADFLLKTEEFIKEARKKGVGLNELINLIGSKYDSVCSNKKIKALFVMGISRQLVDINIDKLKQNIHGVEFEGLFVNKSVDAEKFGSMASSVDMILVPSIWHDFLKEHLPRDIPVIKTSADLKSLGGLKKQLEKKKTKVAVIGENSAVSQTLAGMFMSLGLFKPKLVLSLDNLEKCKKELKEIDSLVVCLSTKEDVEKLKLKNKEIYYFSDYIDGKSIQEIKSLVKELGG